MDRSRIWVLVAIGAVAASAALLTPANVHVDASPISVWIWQLSLMVPVFAVGVGAVALRPSHATARWLAAAGSWLAIATAANRTVPLLVLDAGAPWLLVANLLQVFAMLSTVAALIAVLIAFPDAELPGGWQRSSIRLVWVVPPMVTLLWALAQPAVVSGAVAWPARSMDNPVAVEDFASLTPMVEGVVGGRAALWVIGGAALTYRWRRSSSTVREQLKWPVTAAVVFALLAGLFLFLRHLGLVDPRMQQLPQFNGWVPGVTLVVGSMFVALLRHRLVEVDLWLRRSILFGGLSAVTVVAYLALAGTLGLAAGQRASVGIGVLVTLAAVAVFEPARRRVEAATRRWVFGKRVAGEELLRAVGDVLEDTQDTRRLGETLATTIVNSLELEWVRITLRAAGSGPSLPVAAVGITPDAEAAPDLLVPLVHAGGTIGQIECGPRTTGELSTRDEQLLATVATQAALAVTNAGLAAQLEARLDDIAHQAAELAASRSRILQAQMAERRRIERDIHDGVQQDLIACIARLRLARNQLSRDPELAASTLVELQDHTTTTLERLRELSRGIHPLALTHHGLVAALEAQACRLPLDVTIEADARVEHSRYDEEIESAAYFVICEGLTNIIKHAGTTTGRVQLGAEEDQLIIEVTDDGRGHRPGPNGSGSGITGLGDRVEALGGTLELESAIGTGTTLRAVLPARPGVPADD
jgi:signal transduction histidine kinase